MGFAQHSKNARSISSLVYAIFLSCLVGHSVAGSGPLGNQTWVEGDGFAELVKRVDPNANCDQWLPEIRVAQEAVVRMATNAMIAVNWMIDNANNNQADEREKTRIGGPLEAIFGVLRTPRGLSAAELEQFQTRQTAKLTRISGNLMVLADYRPHLPQAIQIYCDDRTLSLTDWDGFRRPAPPGRGSWLTYFDEEYSQWLPSSPYHYACYLNSTIRAHSLATYREAPARIFLCPNLLRSLSTYWQYGNTVGRIIANDLKLNDLVQRMLAATLAHEIYHTVDYSDKKFLHDGYEHVALGFAKITKLAEVNPEEALQNPDSLVYFAVAMLFPQNEFSSGYAKDLDDVVLNNRRNGYGDFDLFDSYDL